MINSIKKILLVDDEERLLTSMAQRIALLGFEPVMASSGTKAIEIVSKTKVDLAIVDLKMPDMDGLMTITRLKEIAPDLKTVLLTGYGSEKVRRETQNLGSDYYEKDSMGSLWDLIKQFSAQGVSQPTAKGFVDSMGRRFSDLPKIIGEFIGIQELRKDIERLAELDCTVLIQGEAGTGKELAARAIHKLSSKKDQKFLAFNCGCFSMDFQFSALLDSLDEPSYPVPDPADSKKSRFSGTIFLDHFEVMPAETQSEMIQLLDQTGMNDIRLILATNQDLKQRVKDNKFSKDLHQRLRAISIALPPLRERRDDIFPLCSYFLSQLNTEFEKNIESISGEVFSIFMDYPFPGNVRELKHIIERAVILADSTTIEPMHLPERLRKGAAPYRTAAASPESFLSLEEMEKEHILKAIEITQGNRSKAAEILGISRAALWRKLKPLNTGN